MDRLLTVREGAALLRLREKTVYIWVSRGVDAHNDTVRARERAVAEHENVVLEVPLLSSSSVLGEKRPVVSRGEVLRA